MLRMPTAMNGKTRDYNNLRTMMLVAVLIIAAITAICILDSESSDADDVTMTLSKSSVTVYSNLSSLSSEDVTATISVVSTGDKIVVTSDDTAIASVSTTEISTNKTAKITVTAVSTGNTRITVQLLDKDDKEIVPKKYINASVRQGITSLEIVDNKGESIPGKKIEMVPGQTAEVKAKFSPDKADRKLTWDSSDKTVATVDSGKITALEKIGTTKITLTDSITKKTAEITVEVKAIPVSSISLEPAETTVKMKHQVTLTATISPENATNKKVSVTTDSSSLIRIVSQSTTGNKITIVLEGLPGEKEGTATVTVTTEDQKKTDSSKIKVERVPVTGVDLKEEEKELEVDETVELTCKVSPNDATNPKVTWASSNTSVATVDDNGVVKAISPGVATITVTTTEGGFKDSCAITVSKTYTVMGTVDSSGNILDPETITKSINGAAARGLYPSFSVLAVLSESVSMSSEIVQALQKANGGEMAIATINGSIYFDENAIDRIDVSGKTAGITFTNIPPETYPKFGECYVYEISMTKDSEKHPTSFGATGPKIAIPHELAEGEDAKKLKVALVYGDGDALMLRNYSFVTDEDEESAVVFEPPHMSTFMYMFHDSEYISTDSFDIVFVALFLVLVLALGGGVAFLEFHPMASEKFMNLFDNPNKPPKRPRFPGRSRKNEYDDYYNNDYYR